MATPDPAVVGVTAPSPSIEINVFKPQAPAVGVTAPGFGLIIGAAFVDPVPSDTGPASDPPVSGLGGLGVGGLEFVDIKLVLEGDIADIAIENGDLRPEVTLTTAVLISLFTDRRAEQGDSLAFEGDDPRGFWAEDTEDPYGSRLWLLSRSKATDETALQAVEFCAQALEWISNLDIAERIGVEAAFDSSRRLCIEVEIERGSARRWPSLWKGASGAKEFNAGDVSLRLLTG